MMTMKNKMVLIVIISHYHWLQWWYWWGFFLLHTKKSCFWLLSYYLSCASFEAPLLRRLKLALLSSTYSNHDYSQSWKKLKRFCDCSPVAKFLARFWCLPPKDADLCQTWKCFLENFVLCWVNLEKTLIDAFMHTFCIFLPVWAQLKQIQYTCFIFIRN